MKSQSSILNPGYIIAIDGPAGAGKSTIAKLLASKLKFLYIDSGAMYRAVTLYMIKNKLLSVSDSKLLKYVREIDIRFGNNSKVQSSRFKVQGSRFKVQGSGFKAQSVFLNGRNVTADIRASRVNKLVSEVSAKRSVRIEMVRRQKEFGRFNSVVMDGRDIGTEVFKHADLKIYLTASVEERARRRKKDMIEMGEKCSISELIKQIQARDHYDSTRGMSPLSKAQDAIVIDSSKLTIFGVLNQISLFSPY